MKKNKLLEDVRVFLSTPQMVQKCNNFFSSGEVYRELLDRIAVELQHH